MLAVAVETSRVAGSTTALAYRYAMQVAVADAASEAALATPGAVGRQEHLAHIVRVEVVHVELQLLVLRRLDQREQIFGLNR